MANIGYARVSTNDQDTALQMDALANAGVTTIYSEKTSSTGKRPELHRALETLQAGDTLVVWKIDRIARSLTDLLQILADMKKRGIGLKSLTEPIDTSSALGEFMMQILGAVAQLEKAMINQRCIAGQVAAIERGIVFGRPKKTKPEDEPVIVERYKNGESLNAIAKSYGVNHGSIRRIINESKGIVKTGAMPVLSTYLKTRPKG